ncbi:MAG: glucose sorbosone dehydrogenase [Aeromicrobium sp.]|nr:glucose sorbosone dehydrogenase [Aeromicrobium sp.]
MGAATLIGCSRDDRNSQPSAPRATTAAEQEGAGPQSSGAKAPRIAATIATGLNVPWGIAFLDNGDALVSQRDEGSIVRVTTAGEVTTIGQVAGAAGRPGGEGGLLGIAVAPDDSNSVFAYVTTSTDDRIVRMRLSEGQLGPPRELLTGIPIGSRHHGGRLLFDADGTLFVSTGDSGDGALAQDKDSLAGKILRLDQDGKAARGNPFGNRTWSYGHRNIEGFAFDAEGRLWATEFGEKSADELNLIEHGGDYGWPAVEGRGNRDDFVDPKVTWGTDECSPAGLAIAGSTAYLGALQGECLFAVPLSGTAAGTPVAYFSGRHGRIRSVAAAPDGALWVTTSNTDGRGDPRAKDDRIFRVTI